MFGSLFGRHVRQARRRDESGQVLVIVAAGLIALIAMVGLVLDGGYAWGRQRTTQNGADSVAKAGSVVILEWLAGDTTKTVGDVGCAVSRAGSEDGVTVDAAEFTDHEGDLLGIPVPACGTGGAIPGDAQGVKADTSQRFDTFLMAVVGISELTARADATAVVGPITSTGPGLPVTFPQTLEVCDDQEVTYTIRDWNENDAGTGPDVDNTWEPYEILPEGATLNSDNLATIPLCTTGPGSVGWLDFGCGNLEEQITEPCDVSIPIPGWVRTQTGNINCCDDELQMYHGDEVGVFEDGSDGNGDVKVKLPIHTNTCEDDAGVSDVDGDGDLDLNPCPDGEWAGQGNNLWYGVPFWIGFVLDEAYVQGGDEECEEDPGTPRLDDPGGGVGCLKGWLVELIEPPSSVSIGDVNPDSDVDLGIALIN